MNSAMKTLYTCMLDNSIAIKCITSEDPDFFLLIDFYDESKTSIGFYERDGKVGIRAFVRSVFTLRR